MSKLTSNTRFNFQSNRFDLSGPLECEPKIQFSFVIPVLNEEATLGELVNRIWQHAGTDAFEVILIDDGSTDDSWIVIQTLADLYPETIRGIRFRTNRGKSAALQVGFEAVRGDIIFTMDADLQDDPKDIPRFLEKLNEGYDLVSGLKAVRHDPWHKVLSSRVCNLLLSRFSKLEFHDHTSGFKCYRSEVAKSVHLFGELHRIVPSLVGMHGFKATEIAVEHHARQHGVSKYGIEAFTRGLSDIFTLGFLRYFRERPSHFANAFAAIYGVVAFTLIICGLVMGIGTISGLVCLTIAIVLFGLGGVCMIAGLMSELMIRQNQFHPANDSVVTDTKDRKPNERVLGFDAYERRFVSQETHDLLRA